MLAYEGLAPFELGVAAEVFALPRPELETEGWYSFSVCAERPGVLPALGGFGLAVEHGLEELRRADTIVLPGSPDVHGDPSPQLVAALRAAHARGARLVSICSGAFVLAATGLLDGRRAATHWRYAALLARRYPRVEVAADVLYVDGGDVLTSAGTAAGIDLCLHLVRRDHGADDRQPGGAADGRGGAPRRRPGPVHRPAGAGAGPRTTRWPRRWSGRWPACPSASGWTSWPAARTSRRASSAAASRPPRAPARRPGCCAGASTRRCRCSSPRTSRSSTWRPASASPPRRRSGATSRAPTACRPRPGAAASPSRVGFSQCSMKKLAKLTLVLVLRAARRGRRRRRRPTPSATPARRRTACCFCPTASDAERVASWDGVPLDVDVTLPADAATGPFPTIVMLHGWGGTKGSFQGDDAGGRGGSGYIQQRLLRQQRLRGRHALARAASAAPAACRTRARPRPATAAGCAWPTSATRAATCSTCSACSWTRAWPSPARSG